MRRLYTTKDLTEAGITRSAIRWGQCHGRWRKVEDGVYADGPDEPSELDRARAAVLATGGVASGCLAGCLLGLDGVPFTGPDITVSRSGNGRRTGVRRRELAPARVLEVDGVRCTDGLQTLVDLAADLDDQRWEQALESVLRRRLTTLEAVREAASGARGVARIRRVLKHRPPGAPATESLLETLMVQLARTVPGLPPPSRQVNIYDAAGKFVARVDLAWPEIGLFVELDGQHHRGQPVHDARRETAIVAATGWLCGRFTWHEVVFVPSATARRLHELAARAAVRAA